MKVAAITTVRHDTEFVTMWCQYYGSQLGYENLYIVIHGSDSKLPVIDKHVNLFVRDDISFKRGVRDLQACKIVSEMAAELLEDYDWVMYTDSDEFVVVDPDKGHSLIDVLAEQSEHTCISALGIDVLHKLSCENALTEGQPILAQRKHAIVTRQYSKPVAISSPAAWDAGFHRAHGKQIVFEKSLFLFHLALSDIDLAKRRILERIDQQAHQTFAEHMEKRLKVLKEIELNFYFDGDEVFEKARQQIGKPKPNGRIRTRPGFIVDEPNCSQGYGIIIPSRFEKSLPF